MIKAFMFHDIRDHENTKFIERYKLKSFMNVKEFKNKLKYLIEEYDIISSSEIPKVKNKNNNSKYAILTFDDGLLDHYYVADLLNNMGLPGTFFIPTQAVRDRLIISSHKIQFLLASIDEKELVKLILNLTPRYISNNYLWEQYSVSQWENNWWTSEMVFVTNFLRYNDKWDITNSLFNSLITNDEAGFCDDFYLNEIQINEMVLAGHEIGGHGFLSAPLISVKDQQNDIMQSLDYIKKFYKGDVIFSYPNGKYNNDTLKILRKYGCKYAYNNLRQDINNDTSMLELPRYDASQDIIL